MTHQEIEFTPPLPTLPLPTDLGLALLPIASSGSNVIEVIYYTSWKPKPQKPRSLAALEPIAMISALAILLDGARERSSHPGHSHYQPDTGERPRPSQFPPTLPLQARSKSSGPARTRPHVQ